MLRFICYPIKRGYSSSALGRGQAIFDLCGQPFLVVSKPREVNFFLALRQTGSKKPIFDRSPNVQRHGHLGKLATQLSIRDFVTGKSGPPGNRNEAIFIAP